MRFYTTTFHCARGMGLVEILMSLGLMGALAMGGMQLFKTQTKGQRTVEANYEVASVLQQLKTILSKPDNCRMSFQGLRPEAGEATLIRKEANGNFDNVYAVNTWLPGNIKINSYLFSKSFPNLASNETMLRISFSRGQSSVKDQIEKSLKIVYTLDSASNILSCYAFNNNSDTYWIQSLLNPDDIYYMAGKVGVGISDPEVSLDIQNLNYPSIPTTARFSQGGIESLLYVDDPAQSSSITIGRGRGSFSTRGTSEVNDSLGRLQFAGTASYGQLRQASVINSIQTGAAGASAIPADLTFSTSSDGTNMQERMRLNKFGQLGLGTSAPTTSLTVRPTGVALSGSLPTGWGGGIHSFDLWLNGSIALGPSAGNTPAATINNLGDASFDGKVEAKGEFLVGNSGVNCGGSNEGSLRYNKATHKMEFCNGTAWVRMGGFSACQVRRVAVGSGYHSVATSNCLPDETIIGGTSTCESNGVNYSMTGKVVDNGWYAECWHAQTPGYISSTATAIAFCCQ